MSPGKVWWVLWAVVVVLALAAPWWVPSLGVLALLGLWWRLSTAYAEFD